ncbi:MAG: hypothetical protein KME26_21185 [Oscillatoria princeps RMCB-10]|nr:hypothetical protein [Oscillatoria princeps RMCB-10]
MAASAGHRQQRKGALLQRPSGAKNLYRHSVLVESAGMPHARRLKVPPAQQLKSVKICVDAFF